MRMIFAVALAAMMFISCGQESKTKDPIDPKVKAYAWAYSRTNKSEAKLKKEFEELKAHGIQGLMYEAGHDVEEYRKLAKVCEEVGIELHAWIPTMVQAKNPKLDPDWYAVNRLGESAFDKPVYVDHYKFLCPNREGTYDFLEELYSSMADIPELDGIHLDFIRFPDVILARGLWEKYGLVQDKEYPKFDYCYCDKCVADFKEKSGIDIAVVEDPTTNEEWKQFRYDLITSVVNRLAEMAHAKGKEINAAVFPGPSVAKKLVRQEWDKWNLDAVYPMNYNDFYLEGTEWIGDMCKEAVSVLPDGRPVYSGLFICPDPKNKSKKPDPEDHGLIPSEIGDAIRESMENGAAGVCLFTPGRMTKEHWAEFEKAIQIEY